MDITSAKFIISNTDLRKCPKPLLPEYAFIGRSNVGKSSLINMLCSMKKLAKTSAKPGKTQLINHFLINESWYIVDLPGYGYAQVSKSKRATWTKFIRKYLLERQNLICLFILIDSRIPPQKIDLEFMKFLGENQVPFAMVYTKTDGVKSSQRAKNFASYKKEMLKTWEELPKIFKTSAVKQTGREEILEFIEEWNGSFDPSLIVT